MRGRVAMLFLAVSIAFAVVSDAATISREEILGIPWGSDLTKVKGITRAVLMTQDNSWTAYTVDVPRILGVPMWKVHLFAKDNRFVGLRATYNPAEYNNLLNKVAPLLGTSIQVKQLASGRLKPGFYQNLWDGKARGVAALILIYEDPPNVKPAMAMEKMGLFYATPEKEWQNTVRFTLLDTMVDRRFIDDQSYPATIPDPSRKTRNP